MAEQPEEFVVTVASRICSGDPSAPGSTCRTVRNAAMSSNDPAVKTSWHPRECLDGWLTTFTGGGSLNEKLWCEMLVQRGRFSRGGS